jgi:hypothetical protein
MTRQCFTVFGLSVTGNESLSPNQAVEHHAAKHGEVVPGTARLLAGEPAQAGKSRPNQVTVNGSHGQGESW